MRLIDNPASSNKSKGITTINHDYLERMNQVVQYIKDHSDRRLNLDELVEYANSAKYHFSKQEQDGISYKRLPGGLNALFQFYDTPDKLGIIYQSIFAH